MKKPADKIAVRMHGGGMYLENCDFMNRTILVVEDDDNDVLFLQTALKKAGISNPIQIVRDGRQALNYLDRAGNFSDRNTFPLPYLILLDLKLPHVMGLDVLKWLRERPQFDSIVVIVLTSSKNPADIDTAYHLRANAYLVKPSGMDSLISIVTSVKEFWLVQNQPPSIFSDELKTYAP